MSKRVAILAFGAVLLAGCRTGSDGEASTGTPPAGPSPTVASTTATSPTPSLNPVGGAHVEHGGRYWAVYVALGELGDPALDDASAQLAAEGIESYPGTLNCDQGAAEALGVPDDTGAVGVYFETRDQAEAFAATLDPPPAGIARVRTYCAD